MSGSIFSDNAPLRVPPGQEPTEHVPLTAIEPDGSGRGGIVLLHESREFTDALTSFMSLLAEEGWTVAAPNLFHRGGDDEVFGDNLFDDFDATFDWLVSRGVYADCVGVIGFDDAGTAAALVATTRPVGAAVSVAAPGIVEPLTGDATALVDALPSLKAPWLGLYGQADERIPADHVERLQEAVATASVATLVVTYGGQGHRPDEATGPEVEDGAEAIVDAQRRIFDWFDSHLR
ncbi:carboxymethylenebutenolidase [Rhodococcoides trifolii]|uniref:Carboxymethylenebutenolidase n=1 Tax=Rhodococcoides trifolii TaxID=908250 RepID=A0A917G9K8_9NOCA|nr:dienelactone hydrolase family protein [Rhodococcus trifolii]GGG29622.1 carboxymethylenebutenolidase [Rhodococcus trifolii]